MPLNRAVLCSVLGLLLGETAFASETTSGGLTLTPGAFTLHGRTARQRLLITRTNNGRPSDVTRKVIFRSSSPAIARVNADSIVTPVADGEAVITATLDGRQATATVRVIDGDRLLPVTFERDVVPILTRAGCNAGACHGKARGQNGFALSLLSYDTDFDYHAIVNEARGRRIFTAAPEFSLLLRKPSGQMPHGGGKRLDAGSSDYDVLRRWIAAGLPRTPADVPKLLRITVEPSERILDANSAQQLLVTAHYSDGSALDVTHLATFQSSESPIAAVNENGLIQTGPVPGEAAVMARFMEKFAVCNVSIPLAGDVPAELYARLPRKNFIDGHVWDKLQRLGITPSEPASDAVFLRRAYLDVIGRLPTPAEVRAFLADTAADKRAKLVDRLLERPEYADYWANKWADLLRPNPYRVGIKAVYNLDAWLRDAFRKNKPYDQFVRELLTAKGSTFRNGAAVLFRDRREPDEITTPGSRAMELWTVRTQSIFLDSFGRPDPNQDPPCERSSDTTVVQALHLMNAPNLHRKVTADTGRAAALAKSSKTPAEIVEELYLLVYNRLPTAEEKADCVKLFEEKGVTRRQATEDLLWALLNTPEFIFKD